MVSGLKTWSVEDMVDNQILEIIHPWASNVIRYKKLERRRAVIMSNYTVHVPDWVIGKPVRVPITRSFICDGFSVPFFLRWWQRPFDPRYLAGAFTHDHGYANNNPNLERVEWDLIFFAELRLFDMRWTKARTQYRGVRLGGLPAWHRHRRND
jgi:hypothetical protein